MEEKQLPFDLHEEEIEGWEGDDQYVIPFQYSITSYGADYPVETLVSQVDRNDILIPAFQREYVWNIKEASRFVETLLLGLPVPSIFLSREYKSLQFLVIDGQQRLRTLQYFYRGIFKPTEREFGLTGVQPQFEGLTYESLSPEDRRRLNNSIIHLTIVQQDEPSDDNSSIYLIFERLNTTGRALSAQEIRACLYAGRFNELLEELNLNEKWRNLFGSKHLRMRDQELILRFFSLYFYPHKYEKPMKGFLNKYMKLNRSLERESRETLSQVFNNTIAVIHDNLGSRAFKPRSAINAAVFDGIMVGIARRLERGPINDFTRLKQNYDELLASTDFLDSYQTATTDELVVENRLKLATEAFADVK